MKCSVGLDEAHPLIDLALRTASAATRLGSEVTGTLVIGLDDPYCFEPNHDGPRILLPLMGEARPSPLGRGLLPLSSAIVTAGPSEARTVRRYAPTVPIVQADLPPGGPLEPISPVDRAQVDDVLSMHPELCRWLFTTGRDRVDPIETLAVACVEAALLCNDDTPAASCGPGRQ